MLGADPIGEDPEVKLTDQMKKVLYKIQEAPYGTKAWEKAFDSLAKLSVEKPKSKLIQKCYAEELIRAERFEEAIAVLEKLLEFYPTFYDVYSLVIDAATCLKQYDVAASYIQAMRIPLKMNTFSYLSYQEALKGYYEAIGDKEGEAVAKKYYEFGKDFLDEFVEQLNDSLTDEDLEDLDFDDEDDEDEDFDDEELLNSLLAKRK
jgi:tetratricopeptide (TPR) repeat protein